MSERDNTFAPETRIASGDGRKRETHQSDDFATRPFTKTGTGSSSGQLQVRCPNCHAPTEVAVDTRLTDLTCSACGSHFSLVDNTQETRMAPTLTKLGRFDLTERLGFGGFGSVWKARDRELDRTVAIKIPRQGGMTGEEQEKFFREARAAAQLRHPNIVSVHEVGRDGESVYIVSDFIRGVTLGDWLTGQLLTSREAAELCAKIAEALHHAHEQGIVHRDLKPGNVIIDYDGQPHLMDFGLARREVGEVTITLDGQVLGTPAYMSPEQAKGEAHTADRRSDVYSLGVILFQVLTGELPFRGNARMLIYQVIHDEPPSPRKFNANIAKDLETIALKCLEKDPGRRYQTTQEVATELRRFLAGEPIQARPITPVERAFRWVRRNRTVSALLALVVIALVGGTMASTWFAFQARYIRAEAHRMFRAAQRREMELPFLTVSHVASAYIARGQHAEAVKLLERAIEPQKAKLGPKHDATVSNMNKLAWLLATSPHDDVRDGKRSVALATEICELTNYRDAQLVDTLAAGYAEMGDFDSAVKWAEKSLELVGNSRDPDVRKPFEQALANYREKKPTREGTPSAKETSKAADNESIDAAVLIVDPPSEEQAK
jgi:tetratricopeptide (TPR) repeat protein